MSFAKLSQKSVSIPKVLERIKEANQANEWERFIPTMLPDITLDTSLFSGDADFLKIVDALGSQERIRIIRTLPNTVYDWHCDVTRKSAINMLVNGHESSLTLFGEESPNGTEHRNVKRLKYEENTFYAFDTQTPHMVLNLSDETRYVVTVGFNYPFDHLKTICKALKIMAT